MEKHTTPAPKYENRELWLEAAVEALRPLLREAGYKVPTCRVSCGFPSGNARKVLGECHYMSEDKVRQVFITPIYSDPVRVLDVLLHELGHVILGPEVGHKAPFARFCKATGLEGKPTATYAGPDLLEKLKDLADELGTYPHSALALPPRKVQGTRMLKVLCLDCGYVLRTTRTHLDEKGVPTCPCGSLMVEESEVGEDDGPKLVGVSAFREYLVPAVAGDRFRVHFRKTERGAITWTVVDHEAVTARTLEVAGVEVHEYETRATILPTRRDALDFIAAVLEGVHVYEAEEAAAEAEDLLDEEDLDDVLGPVGEWEDEDYLAEDEAEDADYPEDLPVAEHGAEAEGLKPWEKFTRLPATEDEYAAMTDLREESGARKAAAIAAGIVSATD